jgi:hypothetical protein
MPPQTRAGLEDSTTMLLTAANQTKPYRALWRFLTLIVGVTAFIGSTTGTASALTAITSIVSSSGHSGVVGAETRVGVTTNNSGTSSARLSSESPACVGENVVGYDGFVLVSCVATKPAGALVEEGTYVVKTAQGEYVGQSGAISRRLQQHVASGKFTQAEVNAAERAMVTGGKLQREIAEQLLIDSKGGIDGLLNKVNPIGPKRVSVMPNQPYKR